MPDVDTLCANFVWNGKKLVWEWKEPYKILSRSDEKDGWLPVYDIFMNLGFKLKEEILYKYLMMRDYLLLVSNTPA